MVSEKKEEEDKEMNAVHSKIQTNDNNSQDIIQNQNSNRKIEIGVEILDNKDNEIA